MSYWLIVYRKPGENLVEYARDAHLDITDAGLLRYVNLDGERRRISPGGNYTVKEIEQLPQYAAEKAVVL